MDCGYCGARNSEDDHRCRRCGRRLDLQTAKPALDTYPSAKLSSVHALNPRPVLDAPQPVEPVRRAPRQGTLFFTREPSRLIAFESISPRHVKATRARERRGGAAVRRGVSDQQMLDFPPPPPTSPAIQTPGEVVRYCQAPVAVPIHRILAFALDLSIVFIGFGLFLALFRFAGGEIAVHRKTIPIFIAVICALNLFYKLLWCVADADSLGMVWSRLRLLNFDGHEPSCSQRLQRLTGGCLSVLAAGLGILWALVDEESLAWHDHMSKTFPSPVDAVR